MSSGGEYLPVYFEGAKCYKISTVLYKKGDEGLKIYTKKQTGRKAEGKHIFLHKIRLLRLVFANDANLHRKMRLILSFQIIQARFIHIFLNGIGLSIYFSYKK